MDAKKIIVDVVNSLLGTPKSATAEAPQKRTLNDITEDQLLRQKARLEIEMKRVLDRLQQIENDKTRLFAEGVRSGSERQQLQIARQIKALEKEALNQDEILQSLSKQRQVINGFSYLKEKQRILSNSGLSGILNGIVLDDIQDWVTEATIGDGFESTKLDKIIEALDPSHRLVTSTPEDEEVLGIMQQMQRARASSDSDQLAGESQPTAELLTATRSTEARERL